MKIPKPRKLNSGRWNVQVQSGGRRISITADTRQECERRAMIVMLSGGSPDAPKDLTLGVAIEAALEARTNVLSPSTLEAYRSMARTRFASVMDLPLSSIPWQQAVNREAAIVSAKTVKNAWSLVEIAYKHAGLQPPKVKLPQVPRADRPWLTPSQVTVFVDAIRGEPCELPALLALHSLRRSEIFALTYADTDALRIRVRGAVVCGEHSRPTLRRANKNDASSRDVPIVIPRLSDLIEARRPEHRPDEQICDCGLSTPRAQINRICADLGFPEVGLHGLRHSFASLSYAVGMSERETMLIGGWSDINTMHKIYTHIDQALAEQRATKIREFFDAK